MKNYLLKFVTISLVFLLFSCSEMDDYELSETVFIEDPYFPGLPIYSEWGYNSFGAYIDRVEFISTNHELSSKIIIENDTLMMIMRGEYRNETTDLVFYIPNITYDTYDDLLALDATSFDLNNPGIVVELKQGNTPALKLELIDGTFSIKRAQYLFVDEEPRRVILSGVFKFQTFLNDEPITVSNGRFDLGYNYDNFYKIE